MIHEKWEYTARCEACGVEVTQKGGTKKELVKKIHKDGWKVFNSYKTFCPECWERRMKETEPPKEGADA